MHSLVRADTFHQYMTAGLFISVLFSLLLPQEAIINSAYEADITGIERAAYPEQSAAYVSYTESLSCPDQLILYPGKQDPRFGISRPEFIRALKKAAAFWSALSNKTIAVVKDKGNIPVNLVYDDRMAFTKSEEKLRKELAKAELRIDQMEVDYRAEEKEYELMLLNYRKKEASVKKMEDAFLSWVEKISESSYSREDYRKVYQQKKKAVETQQKILNVDRRKVNAKGKAVNRINRELNRLIEGKNKLVQQYNRTYSGKRQFVQGNYIYTGRERNIQIYHFRSTGELEVILAHEIGHALGIDHVKDPQAIMYDHTSNNNKNLLRMSQSDKKAFSSAGCS